MWAPEGTRRSGTQTRTEAVDVGSGQWDPEAAVRVTPNLDPRHGATATQPGAPGPVGGCFDSSPRVRRRDFACTAVPWPPRGNLAGGWGRRVSLPGTPRHGGQRGGSGSASRRPLCFP